MLPSKKLPHEGIALVNTPSNRAGGLTSSEEERLVVNSSDSSVIAHSDNLSSPNASALQESPDVIDVITPAAAGRSNANTAWNKVRKTISAHPLEVSISSSLIVQMLFALSWIGQDVTTGKLIQGARSTYDLGYWFGLNEFRNSTAKDYHILQINDSNILNPNHYEASNIIKHLEIELYVTFCMSLCMNIAMLFALSKKDYKKSVILFALGFALLNLVAYAGFGGFSWLNDEAEKNYELGQQLGNSTYGLADGQNYYCSSMNYSFSCPTPHQYYSLLEHSTPSNTITQAHDNLYFVMSIMVSLMATPIISSAIYGAKELCKFFLFKKKQGERQSLLPATASVLSADSLPPQVNP